MRGDGGARGGAGNSNCDVGLGSGFDATVFVLEGAELGHRDEYSLGRDSWVWASLRAGPVASDQVPSIDRGGGWMGIGNATGDHTTCLEGIVREKLVEVFPMILGSTRVGSGRTTSSA